MYNVVDAHGNEVVIDADRMERVGGQNSVTLYKEDEEVAYFVGVTSCYPVEE